MTVVPVYQVDVFTRSRFKGNPAGVVLRADGLSDEQMQGISRELNNPETAFVLAPTSGDHDVWVRFFTPTTEIASCGHATIAAHYVRALENKLDSCVVRQRIGTGVQNVNIIKVDTDYKISMTQKPIEFADPFGREDRNDIISAIGVDETQLDDRFPLQLVTAGAATKVLLALRDVETLDSLEPDQPGLSVLSRRHGCTGFYVFSVNSKYAGITAHGRMFAPAIGIPEDPVTGNANCTLGPYLVRHGFVRPVGSAVTMKVIQGEAMGRPGVAEITVEMDGDKPGAVLVAGYAVLVFNTVITL